VLILRESEPPVSATLMFVETSGKGVAPNSVYAPRRLCRRSQNSNRPSEMIKQVPIIIPMMAPVRKVFRCVDGREPCESVGAGVAMFPLFILCDVDVAGVVERAELKGSVAPEDMAKAVAAAKSKVVGVGVAEAIAKTQDGRDNAPVGIGDGNCAISVQPED